MKKKELKKLAEQIAQAELIIQNPDSAFEDVEDAKGKIYNLMFHLSDPEDMEKVDEMVQEMIS